MRNVKNDIEGFLLYNCIQLGGNEAWIENKQHSVTFHYRGVPQSEHDAYKLRAKTIIESYGFIPNQAHMAIEAKPAVQWNKGEAALHILREEFGNNWANKVKVIFAGDDTTDEDAMKVIFTSLLIGFSDGLPTKLI